MNCTCTIYIAKINTSPKIGHSYATLKLGGEEGSGNYRGSGKLCDKAGG